MENGTLATVDKILFLFSGAMLIIMVAVALKIIDSMISRNVRLDEGWGRVVGRIVCRVFP